MAQYWRTVSAFVYRELAAEESSMLHPLVLIEAENTVAAAVLSVFPNTMFDCGVPDPGGRCPAGGFARHYDVSPTGYLRRVRLEHAHRDLQRADPAGGDDVIQIARRWGFGNLSQFDAFYHRAYGVAPTQTLLTT